jgi:RNA polymerase sigma-70 factor (ECF subfamily)
MFTAVQDWRLAMSDVAGRVVQDEVDQQNLFITGNLRRVFLMIYRIVGNVADAQDLTQETFIKALQREGQLKDTQKAGHWLSRIATNTAIDFLRRHGRVTFTTIESTPEPLTSSRSDGAEELLLQAERRAYVQDGLRLLTERERLALVLRDVEGLPAEEVARRLGCSKATVRSHIANARVKFRRYVQGRKS